MALGVVLMSHPAARLYPKIGPRQMMMAGFAGTMIVTLALVLVDYSTSTWWIAANMLLRGLFFGLLLIPMQAATFMTIRPEDMGRASSIFNVGRQVAASLGVAILATALANRLNAHAAILGAPASRAAALTAFHDVFLFTGALAILGFIACLVIDDRKAAYAVPNEFGGEEAGYRQRQLTEA